MFASAYDSAEFNRTLVDLSTPLGAVCQKASTTFRLWAPTASEVILNLYSADSVESFTKSYAMNLRGKGVYELSFPSSLHGTYYTYTVTTEIGTHTTCDPYARACGANGTLSMVVDLSLTNPEGFDRDSHIFLPSPTDAVIYELHVRDFSIDTSSGSSYPGKFLAFTETDTKSPEQLPTGIQYLKELGITHVHLMPSFDYATVDELHPNAGYNWGYDPQNYNIPEGSYCTNPSDGASRIREMKEAVMSLHRQGIGVIMDVVYNHTYFTEDSCFHRIVPYYYHRTDKNNRFSNGSACGNETASERPMVRRYMMDSLLYFAKEYHIDGFRFDLMGLHDVETMAEIRKAMDTVSPHFLLYGEGWTGGETVLPESKRAIKSNVTRVPGISVFNDVIRDTLKGSVFDAADTGFISGKIEEGVTDRLKLALCGCCFHPSLNRELMSDPNIAYAKHPYQSVNYVSAHDNLTLWDKLQVSCPKEDRDTLIRRNLFAAACYFTAQGIPFFQAGEEFLRSKPSEDGTEFVENSYNSPDSVNSLKWNRAKEYQDVVQYYKGLIAFRKAHPLLRLSTLSQLSEHLSFLPVKNTATIALFLSGSCPSEPLSEIVCLYNPTDNDCTFTLPGNHFTIFAEGTLCSASGIRDIKGSTVSVPGISCMLLGRK